MMDLSKYTMLDLSWLSPGPYGSMFLADMGMDVIKIEEPERGDYLREYTPDVGETGDSNLFYSINRNKKSVALDLKTELGREVFLEMAETADVVFEQFRPGKVDELGVGYDDVRQRNENIVYCSLTGYGQYGPYKDRPGHSLNYEATAGMISDTKPRDSSIPVQPSFPIGDMAGGLMAALSIVSALLHKESGGGGQHIDVAMTDVVLSMATGQEWMFGADENTPDELFTPPEDMNHPSNNVYETKDGEFITIACVEEKFWRRFLDHIDRPELQDYRYAFGDDKEYAIGEIEAEIRSKTRDEWDEIFGETIPYAPVIDFEDVPDHPYIQSREVIKAMDIEGGEMPMIGLPFETTAEIDEMREGAPNLGEHTEEVLGRVRNEEEIEQLRRDDVIP